MIKKLKVAQLKEMAKEANIKNFKSMKKAELIKELQVSRKYGTILDYMEDYGISLEEAKDLASE